MRIKLSIVVGVHNQFELASATLKMMRDNCVREDVEVIIIDNGSSTPFTPLMIEEFPNVRVVRNEGNTGNYPLFFQGLAEAKGEVIAFLHSDVFVHQRGWDEYVVQQFDGQPQLGLMGFIGSTEIDNWGGRGMGTISNMQGKTIGRWKGSAAHIHGRQDAGMTIDGSVVDGCVMIFRRSVLEQIPFRENFVLHHFYDRLFSCEVIERGFKVGILGIEFDHCSGQTANHEQGWQNTSAAWFYLHHKIEKPQQWADLRAAWVKHGNSPSRGKVPDQWDYASYLEGEYLFLSEYRDQKHMIPMRHGKKI